MAKVTPTTIQGAYASTSELNANFAALAAEFENCVSLDGTSPSAMTAALDMNNQNILNAGTIGADTIVADNLFVNLLTYTGVSVAAADVSLLDTAAIYTAEDVEAALAEVKLLVDTNVTKLSGIEAGATADQTDAEIRAAVAAATDSNVYTDAEKTVVGNQSGTNTGDQTIPVTGVDFDPVGTDNSDDDAINSLYSGLVSNATHTGDVTGSTTLTIAAGAVDIAMLSASGTPDATTFLRGDNTWQVPAGSGGGSGHLAESFFLMGG